MATEYNLFEVEKEKNRLVITFSSTERNVDRACSEALKFLFSRLPSIQQIQFSANLVIREGLTNAVRHGNKSNPEKVVQFEVMSKKDAFQLKIEDQGDGFNWQAEENSVYPEDFEHGRGLKIMKEYAFDRMFNTKGNTLYLEKRLPTT